MMDSARESDDRGQMVGMPRVWFAVVTIGIAVLVVDKLRNASGEELRAASEQTTTVCKGMWNCGAAELIPPLVLVAIAALIISVPKRVRSDDE
jgi:hypothetical protein